MGRPSEGQPAWIGSRGRSATINPAAMATSQPRFISTDASSQDDLYTLPRRYREQNTVARPKTGGGRPREPATYSAWPIPDQRVPESPGYVSRPSPHPLRVGGQQHPAGWGIGMALGSPSHSPWSASSIPITTSAQSFLATTPSGMFSAVPYEPSVSPNPEDALRQKGRWKVFGGLFSKKSISPLNAPASIEDDEPVNAQEEALLHPRPLNPNRNAEAAHNRSWSRSLDLGPTNIRSIPIAPVGSPLIQPRPSIPKLHTAPVILAKQPSPIPPPKDKPIYQTKVELPPTPPMLLEVDIPDVSMERYSVMFGNVIKSRQSSLMARRQAQLGRLKVNNSVMEEEEETEDTFLHTPVRRSTLPSPAKPSSYSLFPSAPGYRLPPRSSSRSPGALQRSATTPSISPARPEFAASKTFYKEEHFQDFTDVETPSTSTASPETPRDPVWSPGVSPKQTEVDLLEEQSINPRDQFTEIVIQISEDPKRAAKMRALSAREKVAGTFELGKASKPSVIFENKKSISPVIKVTTPTSPYADRLASLNKPLPSPLGRNSNDSYSASNSPRKASLPLQSKYNVRTREERKASLPAPPTYVLEKQPPRKASLALQPPTPQARPFEVQEQCYPIQSQLPRAVVGKRSPEKQIQARVWTSQPSAQNATMKRSPANSSPPPNPLKSSPASPAEISVARQISISRRQHMMVPIVPKSVRQPQKATLVNPNMSSMQVDGGSMSTRGYAIRKSHHILLETV